MLTALVFASCMPSQDVVELYRQWSDAETLTYQVRSNLQIESRHYLTSTFIPEDLDTDYQFTMASSEVTGEGFAQVEYKKPIVEVTEGETVDHPPIKKTEEVNEHYIFTMSPVNAITDLKDLTPKKEEDDGDGDGDGQFKLSGETERSLQQVPAAIGNFISELYRLALFIGNTDTALDFGPRLPLFEVETGEEWEVTASYQPQSLKGKEGKMAPQRIDYTYTYVGVQEIDGKKIHRVTADLDLDTDIAPFLNDMMGMNASQSGLRGLRLKMTAHIDFDLDYETKHTLKALARSNGEMTIEITEVADRPLIEEKLRGRTTLKLLERKTS